MLLVPDFFRPLPEAAVGEVPTPAARDAPRPCPGMRPRLPGTARAVHHVALRVADPEGSLRFYAGLLGLNEIRRSEEGGRLRAVWLEAGGTILMLETGLKGQGPASGSGHVLAFEVDDLAASEALLESAGVGVDDRTAHTLYVRDPDGHRVGLTVFPRGRP